ncbi:hypothetical protein CD790_30915 [Streptomyces sp. SAJ15]|nr:hypothetical protein CD790_30915 [Streptomyces sp. SAJ15]
MTIDGFLDTVPEPGDTDGTVRFLLVSSPTDDPVDEAILPCTTGDPRIVHALLTELRSGDLLHVSGILTLPGSADGGVRLSVDALEVLATAPVRGGTVLDRFGPYLVVLDADHDQVPIFTETGRWVGEAGDPDKIRDLIDAFERDATTDDG